MTDIAIRVQNLSKMYRIGAKERARRNLRQTARSLVAAPFDYLRRMSRPPTEEETLWALRDVSFEVKRGEVLGIIGRNGAGNPHKGVRAGSTLLKILSRITEPTEGRADIHGRVASLLDAARGPRSFAVTQDKADRAREHPLRVNGDISDFEFETRST